MNTIRMNFTGELKILLCKRNTFLILSIFILLIMAVEDGFENYQTTLENKNIHQIMEEEKISQYLFYDQYSIYGIRVMFIPSTLCIFFDNSTIFKDVNSNFDSGERLNITTNMKGENLFSLKNGEFMDFSGIIILLGLLIALLYGYFGAQARDYSTYLSSAKKPTTIFRSTIIARIILLNMVFMVLTGLCLLWLLLRGLNLPIISFLIYLVVASLILAIFVNAGAAIGTLSNKTTGILLVIVYFSFIFLIPWAVNKITYVNAYDIQSNYKMEFEKLKLMMSVEKKIFEQVGFYKNLTIPSDKLRQVIKKARETEFKKFFELENNMKNEMIKRINEFHLLSALFPTTFYISCNYELSSKGYGDFIDFYSYSIEKKFQFIDFYIQKKYESKVGDKVESFIKGDENLYYSKSRVPGFFWLGLLIQFVYLIALFFLADYLFIRSLKRTVKSKHSFNRLNIRLTRGHLHTFSVYDEDFTAHLLNIFFGNIKNISGQVSIDGVSLITPEQKSFLFLPNYKTFPGQINVNDFIKLNQSLLNLSEQDIEQIQNLNLPLTKNYELLTRSQKATLLLTIAKQSKKETIILEDFLTGVPMNEMPGLIMLLEEIQESGKVIIELLPNYNLLTTPHYVSSIRMADNYLQEIGVICR